MATPPRSAELIRQYAFRCRHSHSAAVGHMVNGTCTPIGGRLQTPSQRGWWGHLVRPRRADRPYWNGGPARRGCRKVDNVTEVDALPTFDFAAFFATVDEARRDRDLGWYDLAGELWDQSAQLNAERDDHPLCGGAVSRLGARGETSCQHALYLLRWLGQAPEDFLTGPAADVGEVRLPDPGPESLRADLL